MRPKSSCLMSSLSAILIVCSQLGCVAWQDDLNDLTMEPLKLPKTRLSRDSVVFDIRFVELPAGDEVSDDMATIWQELDQEHLSLPLRDRLSANGFRAGVFGEQLPDALRGLLEPGDEEAPEGAAPRFELNASHRRLQARSRKRHEIIAADPSESLSAFLNTEGSVRGETFYNAQCTFDLRSFPQGDGRVRIEITPEIHHGEPSQKWASDNGVFQFIASREKKAYKDLSVVATLSPGETIAITSGQSEKGLGKLFFLSDAKQAKQRMLLVRLSLTQWDNLFEPDPIDQPLATSERD